MKTMRNELRSKSRVWSLSCFAAALLVLGALPAQADYGYSYFRTVEGYADLETREESEALDVQANHPLVAGDLLRVGSDSRIEVVLSDGSLLRIADRTEIRFDSMAWTPDSSDEVTRLTLFEGEAQIVLGDDLAGEPSLEIDTGNASLYLRAPGEYRVTVSVSGATEVIVRDGFAEAATERGSTIVRPGEGGFIQGGEDSWVDIARARELDDLEYWGRELDSEAQVAQVTHVDPQLRYRAARMSRHGQWSQYGGRYGWRPYVSASWRPYVSGSWIGTPSGLTWVSSEPWGWVPSHYGSWDLVPGHGWVWFAGARYSPASVYWYWGPTHVGWVPSGYYTSYYGYRSSGFRVRLGVYGWSSGHWGHYQDWTFCPTGSFGRRGGRHHYKSGHEVGRHHGSRDVPRGVIATDTRSLGRETWGRPEMVEARLKASSRLERGEMVDVTDFVARRRDLTPKVDDIVRPRAVAASSREQSASRVRSVERIRESRPPARRSGVSSESRGAVRSQARPQRTDRFDIDTSRYSSSSRAPRSSVVRRVIDQMRSRKPDASSGGRPRTEVAPPSRPSSQSTPPRSSVSPRPGSSVDSRRPAPEASRGSAKPPAATRSSSSRSPERKPPAAKAPSRERSGSSRTSSAPRTSKSRSDSGGSSGSSSRRARSRKPPNR